jgi:hypothetical protein
MNATADMVESKKAIHRNRTRNRDDLGSVSEISTQKHSFDGGSSGGSCTDDSFLHMLKASRRQNAVQKPSINVVRDGSYNSIAECNPSSVAPAVTRDVRVDSQSLSSDEKSWAEIVTIGKKI